MSGDESSGSEEEYEVERIVGKRVRFGKVEYRVKWVGYPESDNTWQAVDTMNCPDLIEEYERAMEKSMAVASKSPKPPKTSSRRKNTQNKDHGARLRVPKGASATGASSPESASAAPPMVPGDWEDEVVRIDTVTRADHGKLHVWVQWQSGEITEELASEANVRCPQKVIQFYESRLKFPGEKRSSS